MQMALLGDDGRGFDLARRLEAAGVWRTWLGDSLYSTFHLYLSSPSSWDEFMRVDDSKSSAQIQLQLRVRALLFDKATASLFHHSPDSPTLSSSSSSAVVSKLNPNYLQLHGDDVYYTLENTCLESAFQRDLGGPSNSTLSKRQSRPGFASGTRQGTDSQRSRNDQDFPDTWYTSFISRHGFKYGVSVGGQETDTRTPQGMSTYLRAVDNHKRKRAPFQQVPSPGTCSLPTSVLSGTRPENARLLLPETMFRMNSVPETALPPITRIQDKCNIDLDGVLDTLPNITCTSPVMIERLGLMPEHFNVDQRGGLRRNKDDKLCLGEDQASQLSRKFVACVLMKTGFESAKEAPLDVFSQLVSRHVCKLGGTLKLLTDNYKKQCSATELIKMFLHATGHSDLTSLSELVKDGTRNLVPPNQQVLQQQLHPQVLQQPLHPQVLQQPLHPQVLQQPLHPQVLQQLLHPQQQPPLRMQRQMYPQMVQSQNLSFQPQVTSLSANMDMGKERPLVLVDLENPSSELPSDGYNNNAFNPRNPRHRQQMQQLRQQQQMDGMSNLHHQEMGHNQFMQSPSNQIPQKQTQTMGMVRAQPIRVQGFHELMSGDSSRKQDSDDKLRSPLSK